MTEFLYVSKAEWMDEGHCRKTKIETEEFFPPRGGNKEAHKLCDPCTVKKECLTFAIENHITHGVWGGTSGRQRRPLQRAFAAAQSSPTQGETPCTSS